MGDASLLAVFKLLGVFALVIFLLRLSLPVGAAMGAAAVALGVAFSMRPWGILEAFWAGVSDEKTLLLTLMVTLILILTGSMERLGQLEELLARFRIWVRGNRWGLLAFPALIGLLPMPGGAVFSAPMLDAFDREKRIEPALKSFLNYWYRHVWEYWWPLYPGVLLTCAIAHLDLWHYVFLALPLSGLAIAGGLPHLGRVPRIVERNRWEADVPGGRGAWRALLPMLLAILPGVGFGLAAQMAADGSWLSALPKEAGLVLGLAAGIVWAWWERGASTRQIRGVLLDPRLVRMWVTIAGVFVFKSVMEKSDASQQVGQILLHSGIPLGWVAVVLPMMVGMVSGLTLAFVGASFPILVSLIQGMDASHMLLPLMILAFASGFAGVLMTPLHLCLILSNEYFKAAWSRVYGYLWLSGLILLGGSIAYFWLVRATGLAG